MQPLPRALLAKAAGRRDAVEVAGRGAHVASAAEANGCVAVIRECDARRIQLPWGCCFVHQHTHESRRAQLPHPGADGHSATQRSSAMLLARARLA